MIKVNDILELLKAFAPTEDAESWDNVGLIVGDGEAKVKKILVTLDITPASVREAIDAGADLIVSHHPVIFKPVYNVRSSNCTGDVVRSLIKNDISAICMHTNLDVAEGGVNDELAKTLRLRHIGVIPQSAGLLRYGYLEAPMRVQDFVKFVSDTLGTPAVKYTDIDHDVNLVAVGGGACGDFMSSAVEFGCDAFVSSDLKYNTLLDADYLGICAVDAGHFNTERPVCNVLERIISDKFSDILIVQSNTVPNIKGI